MASVKQTVQHYSNILRKGQRDPDFFELVRRLDSERNAVGQSRLFQDEKVRFGQNPYLCFPKTTIDRIAEKDDLVRIFVNFMGLTGANGPMPLEFTSFVNQRAHNEYDFSPCRFLDIINHRFIGLFYRAWKHHEQTVTADHPKDDMVATILKNISGRGCDLKSARDTADAEIFNADIFGLKSKSAAGLEALLQRHFHLPLHIREHQVGKVPIAREFRCIPGKRGCSELGKSIQLGRFCWSNSYLFQITTEVISYEKSLEFMPGTNGFDTMARLIFSYLDRPLRYDFTLNVDKRTLPEPCLNGSLALGRGIWLSGKRFGVYPLKIGASRIFRKERNHAPGSFQKKICFNDNKGD